MNFDSFVCPCPPPILSTFTNQDCPHCGANEFIDYKNDGDRVCANCGAVVDDIRMVEGPVPDDWSRASSLSSVKHRQSAYKRDYHGNERAAQYFCTGPASPAWLVDTVVRTVKARKIPKYKLPRTLNHIYIKQICSACGASKYAERWIEIRKRVLRKLGIPCRSVLPGCQQWMRFLIDFNKASLAFDRKLYVGGRRKTCKDHLWSSQHPLARHNFPNYNLAFHHIAALNGFRARIDAHFYFPLLRTRKVLEKLQSMWEVICKHNRWRINPLSTILDRTYNKDLPHTDATLQRNENRPLTN